MVNSIKWKRKFKIKFDLVTDIQPYIHTYVDVRIRKVATVIISQSRRQREGNSSAERTRFILLHEAN